MESHTIHLIGGADEEAGLLNLQERDDDFWLGFTYRSKTIEACADDFFEAFCQIRLVLEKEHLIPFCYGASLNVYPSGMARNMGGGLKAYKLNKGRHAKMEDLVYIFSEGPDVVPSQVSRQKEFFEEWLNSLRA